MEEEGSPDAPETSILNDLGDVFLAVNCYRLMPGTLLAAMFGLVSIMNLLCVHGNHFPDQIIGGHWV